MGNVFNPCTSKQNQSANHDIVEGDLLNVIPQILSISQSEFKRIYKQSKKSKYSKKLLSKISNITNINPIDDTKLMKLPSYKTSDSFINEIKSLINRASLLSLVIIKDIIFQIQTISDHVHRYEHQYNAMYLLQLKQRYVNIEELIMIHCGAINDLYVTINILLRIGYETDLYSTNYLVLLYEDLSFLDLIKFHISLKEKLQLKEKDYEQYKLYDKRYSLYERLRSQQHRSDRKKGNCNMEMKQEHENEMYMFNDVYLLISGYLEIISYYEYYIIEVMIELVIKFYLIPNDTNYSHMLSFSQREYPYCNGLKLDVYNFNKLSSYSLNISGLNSDGTHYMYLIRNISLPKWIRDDIVDLGQLESIYDNKYFRVMNSNNLCCIYDQITYQTFDLNGISNNNNKQAMIVFDPNYPQYGGYNIEFGKSFALNLYLWKADRKIYHRGRNSIICLNRIGNRSTLSEYNIDENTYAPLGGILHIDRCEGAGMCIFDNQTKFLFCGGRTQCICQYEKGDNCKCNTLKSSEIYPIEGWYNSEYDDFGYTPISDMNLSRMEHGMLYNKELQKIIVGGGQDIIGGYFDINSYLNKYRYLTPHTIEILDLNKNKWKLIECKTQNGYASNPYLWYHNQNPFIINIFNSYLSYSGKRANHSEFIDIREQKKWLQNSNINNYLKENDTAHISMF